MDDSRDLLKLFNQINKLYFDDEIQAKIYWGKQKTPTTWGLYYDDGKEIVVNPLLKLKWVPLDFLRYIIYHEMLHQVVPSIEKGKYVRHHTLEFRKKELLFPNALDLELWEHRHIHRFRRIKSDFKAYCHKFSLKTEDLGSQIKIDNTIYTIAGLHPWNKQNPVVLRNPQGKLNYEEARFVKYLLGSKNDKSQSKKSS
jgi:predicted SprT family Zn-dependent metalloprotease